MGKQLAEYLSVDQLDAMIDVIRVRKALPVDKGAAQPSEALKLAEREIERKIKGELKPL